MPLNSMINPTPDVPCCRPAGFLRRRPATRIYVVRRFSADRRALEIARELVRTARARGVGLTGPDGMLKALTKTVIETALDEEMAEHLGYGKHDPLGRNSGNSRNGVRTTTVLTDNVGPIEITVPRDRDGTFTPVIVGKRQRRLGDADTIVLSLSARG